MAAKESAPKEEPKEEEKPCRRRNEYRHMFGDFLIKFLLNQIN